MPKTLWGILIAETLKQRAAEAAIGLADIAQVIARAAQLATTGRVLDAQGQIKPVSAATARALLSATVSAAEGSPSWSPETLAYRLAGQRVDALTVKGASSAIARDSQAKIRVLADRLSAGTIEVQEWYAAMKVEVKTLHMAESALAPWRVCTDESGAVGACGRHRSDSIQRRRCLPRLARFR